MGRASQRKGRAGELELARILQGYGYDVQPGRAQSYGEVPDLSGLPGVHIECKRNEPAECAGGYGPGRPGRGAVSGWSAHRVP